MKEEAVSPVVAFMLLLMIIVSFISILNAYYIPSLKQQAEIEHLYNVEQSFLKISSDILQILTFKQNMTMTESIQLGGGDVYFSPIKSSGYLEVNSTLEKEPLGKIILKKNNIEVKELKSNINSTSIIYRPVGNFWINQGYEWRDGVINITKDKKWTYLDHTNDINASLERNSYIEMLSPKITVEEYQKNVTSIKIDLLSIEKSEDIRSYNGNGLGKIFIELKKSFVQIPISINHGDNLSFESNVEIFNSSLRDSFVICNSGKKNNVIWFDNNYSLKISDNPIYPIPEITFTKWNLSIHF